MKFRKISFISFLILILIFPLLSFGTTENNIDLEESLFQTTSSILSLSSKSIKPDTEFYLILNLSQITYNKFQVEITNTASIPADDVSSDVSNLKTTSNVTSFTIDKTLINLDKLGIVYTSPSQETNVVFNLKITDLDTTKETLTEQLNLLQEDLNDSNEELSELKSSLSKKQDELKELEENNVLETDEKYINLSNSISGLSTYIETLGKEIENKLEEIQSISDKITNFSPETLEEKTTLTVREDAVSETDKDLSTQDKTNPWDDKDSLLEEMDKEKTKEMTASMKKMMEQMTKLETNLKSANDTISSLTQNVTYQGSQNNYLSSLSISGVEFKNTFKKTTSDYFATVDENTTKVTVNAVAEDSSAIVTIYGNTNLKSGKNKILINVTADDESIRTYRIYITK